VHNKTLADDCAKCHNVKGWKELKFDHDKNSDYKLTGKHVEVKCENCHPKYSKEGKTGKAEQMYQVLQFKPLKYGNCNDCHFDIHAGKLKEQTCKNCHATDGWTAKTFKHNDPQFSNYELAGKHENVSCELCHPKETVGIELKGQSTTREVRKLKDIKYKNCSDCHYDVHKEQFKDQRCDSCHTVKNEWKKITFRHEEDQYKGYKLEGKHKDVECEKCHARSELKFTEFNKKKKAAVGAFKGVKSENCSDCHFDIHKEQFKDQRCDSCHTVKNEWKKTTFRHEDDQYKGEVCRI
jgi:hypothetical protein